LSRRKEEKNIKKRGRGGRRHEKHRRGKEMNVKSNFMLFGHP
jgi:hypothetical protein